MALIRTMILLQEACMTSDSDERHIRGPKSPDGRCYGWNGKRCRDPVDLPTTVFWCPSCNEERKASLEAHHISGYQRLLERVVDRHVGLIQMAAADRYPGTYWYGSCGRWWADVLNIPLSILYRASKALSVEDPALNQLHASRKRASESIEMNADECICDRRRERYDRNGNRVRQRGR